MKEKHSTLQVLYSLVQHSLHPTRFACTPAEVITHHFLPWDTILAHLTELAREGLVIFSTPSLITITKTGVEKVQDLNKNEISRENTVIEKVA